MQITIKPRALTEAEREQHPGLETLRVLYPLGGGAKALAPEGETVTLDSFWRRRLACGDVEEVMQQPKAGSSPPSKRKKSKSEKHEA